MGIDEAVGLLHQLPQPVVGAPRSVDLRKAQEGLVSLLVFFLQDLRQDIVPHQLELSLVRHPEARIQGQKLVILLDEVLADAVYGGDAGPGKQGLLEPEPAVLRVLPDGLPKGRSDPFPHLLCRSPGKGHDQKTVHGYRILRIRQHPEDPRHQHRSLSASCRCGYQQIFMLRIYDLLLLFRPFHD